MAAPPPDAESGPAVHNTPALLTRHSRAAGPFSLRPAGVARPTTLSQVAELVRKASRDGVPLIPRGAGTGMPGGNVGTGVSLDMGAFTTVQRVGDLNGRPVFRVGAGATGEALDRAAQEVGHHLPALPSSAARCTLGGMAANNSAGARSYGYGAMAAWITAAEVVTADGEARRLTGDPDSAPPSFRRLRHELVFPASWPRVRKNSSGYALDRFLPEGDPLSLLVGSEGTLGVITEVEVAVAPLPHRSVLQLVPVPTYRDLRSAVEAAGVAKAAACEFLGRRFLDISGVRQDPEFGKLLATVEAALLVEVDDRIGHPDEGAEVMRRWAREVGVPTVQAETPYARSRLWSLRHRASPMIARSAEEGRISMQFIEDSVVPPEVLPDYLAGVEAILAEAGTDAVMFGHAGDGNVHVNPLVDVTASDWRARVRTVLERTAHLVAALGGTLAGEHGDGRLRPPFHPLVWGEEAAAAFRTVKDTLDPEGILNPGVVVALPGQDPLEGLSAGPRLDA